MTLRECLAAALRRVVVPLFLLLLCQFGAVDAVTCASYDAVQVQLKWTQQAQFAGYMVAVENGYYRDQCLDVAIRPGGPNINMEEEVLANRAQFGLDWLASLLTRREAGNDVVIISQVFARTGNVEVSFRSNGYTQPRDLIGKKVCVWMGGNELSLKALVDAYGMKWDNDTTANQAPGADLNIIQQSYSATQFLSGDCDAASVMKYNEIAIILETMNPATGQLYKEDDLFSFLYDSYNVSSFEDAIFASKEWLEQPGNRDIAVRFLRASMKGWIYARDFPDRTVELLFSRSIHQSWMLNEVSKLIFPTWSAGFGLVDMESLQMSADRVYRYGIIQNRANVSDFYRMDLQLEAQQGYLGQLSNVITTPGWAKDEDEFIYGSDDIFGIDFVGRNMRFCYNNDILSICTGDRVRDPNDYLSETSGGGVSLLFLAAISLILLVLISLSLIYYRKKRDVIIASLPFCLLICLGASILMCSILVSLGEVETSRCHARFWLMGLGFILFMGSFVIKVRRIDEILNSKSLVAKRLPNLKLFQHISVLLSIEVVLLVLFSALSNYRTNEYDDPNLGRLEHRQCKIMEMTGADVTTIALLFIYKALILFYGVLLAFRTKDVNSAVNESRYLALCIYNIVFVAVIAVPIIAFVDMKPNAKIIVADLAVLCAVMFSTMVLFVPKLYGLYHSMKPERDRRRAALKARKQRLQMTQMSDEDFDEATPGKRPPRLPFRNDISETADARKKHNPPTPVNGAAGMASKSPTPAVRGTSTKKNTFLRGSGSGGVLAPMNSNATHAATIAFRQSLRPLPREVLLVQFQKCLMQLDQLRTELRHKGMNDSNFEQWLQETRQTQSAKQHAGGGITPESTPMLEGRSLGRAGIMTMTTRGPSVEATPTHEPINSRVNVGYSPQYQLHHLLPPSAQQAQQQIIVTLPPGTENVSSGVRVGNLPTIDSANRSGSNTASSSTLNSSVGIPHLPTLNSSGVDDGSRGEGVVTNSVLQRLIDAARMPVDPTEPAWKLQQQIPSKREPGATTDLNYDGSTPSNHSSDSSPDSATPNPVSGNSQINAIAVDIRSAAIAPIDSHLALPDRADHASSTTASHRNSITITRASPSSLVSSLSSTRRPLRFHFPPAHPGARNTLKLSPLAQSTSSSSSSSSESPKTS